MPIQKLKLSALESSFNFKFVIPPITSITFLEGNLEEIIPIIRYRWRLIVNANPWLTGKLIKDKSSKRLQLVYSDDIPVSENALDEIFLANPKEVNVHEKMSYKQLLKAVKPVAVKDGYAIVNKPHPTTILTLVADAKDKNKFALIFSMSHIVADGHCYYNILNMLSNGAVVKALNPVRKEAAIEKSIDAVGRKEWGFVNTPMVSVNFLKGIFFGGKPKIYGFYVNDDQIHHHKNEVRSTSNGKARFVSTNDIITSSFFNFIKARFAMMAINLRIKLPEITDVDSGNYEAVVVYDQEGYAQPTTIRQSLSQGPPYLGVKKSLPKPLEATHCTLGLITNWATFGKEIILPHSEEILHLPLFPMHVVGYEFAIIFRPKRGKLGMILCTKKYKAEDYKKSAMPLGEVVSEEIFA